MSELLDYRIVGALRFVDATTRVPLDVRLQVDAVGARFVRNLSGAYAITHVRGLEAHADAFPAPPSAPGIGSVKLDVQVVDPARRYLPRMVRVQLPRDPDLAHAADPASLFRPIEVPLYPAPAAPAMPGWAVLRASIRRNGTDEGLPWVLLRLREAGADPAAEPPLARGISDARGEAVVPVSGIPVTNWNSAEIGDPDDPSDDVPAGPVLATEIDAVLEAYFDPTATSPPDPDLINTKRQTLAKKTVAVKLASGKHIAVRVDIDVP